MIDSITVLNSVVGKRLQLIRDATRSNSITSAEWKLLDLIEKGISTQEQLVKATDLAASTISRQIKKCFEKKLVRTCAIDVDHRKIEYYLTEDGAIVLKRVNKLVDEINKKMFSHWTDEEISMFNILANRILRNLNITG
ncbi:hypothetical protein PECL_944 [Pediococcus claussenii ATCC BAA-344]|uniref:HTH marR-type domain-containing protein n=2 Tax=Pediococcus claussenii TaxID=187452 RepID=G8PD78_PEDCP|nr:MarR family winged helix-turn-helix transcriptional regulator [Pediococcus claussenii]AEV95213.1 hypothetical protein PECL_944 [Pediococcus claussenii ATCC BAA-344]ANZ70443.1 hypothetical protein AYR57_08985 [Pediococcus claussenii]ANZ72258.1 hypothetical protein AYR58_08985 [Pediococcus claussenii]